MDKINGWRICRDKKTGFFLAINNDVCMIFINKAEAVNFATKIHANDEILKSF